MEGCSSCANYKPTQFDELKDYKHTGAKGWAWRTPYDQKFLAQYNAMNSPMTENFVMKNGSVPIIPTSHSYRGQIMDYRTPYDKRFLAQYDAKTIGAHSNWASF